MKNVFVIDSTEVTKPMFSHISGVWIIDYDENGPKKYNGKYVYKKLNIHSDTSRLQSNSDSKYPFIRYDRMNAGCLNKISNMYCPTCNMADDSKCTCAHNPSLCGVISEYKYTEFCNHDIFSNNMQNTTYTRFTNKFPHNPNIVVITTIPKIMYQPFNPNSPWNETVYDTPLFNHICGIYVLTKIDETDVNDKPKWYKWGSDGIDLYNKSYFEYGDDNYWYLKLEIPKKQNRGNPITVNVLRINEKRYNDTMREYDKVVYRYRNMSRETTIDATHDTIYDSGEYGTILSRDIGYNDNLDLDVIGFSSNNPPVDIKLWDWGKTIYRQ